MIAVDTSALMAIILGEPGNGTQGFGNRIISVCRELMTIGLDIGEHDLFGEYDHRARIVMRADCVQIIDMAHEGLIARPAGGG